MPIMFQTQKIQYKTKPNGPLPGGTSCMLSSQCTRTLDKHDVTGGFGKLSKHHLSHAVASLKTDAEPQLVNCHKQSHDSLPI